MSYFRDKDEDMLLANLRRGLEASDPVPNDVTEFAKAALGWRTIDTELAAISFDSNTVERLTGLDDTATSRILSFEMGDWAVEIEHNPATGRLTGQIEPSRQATVEIHFAGGTNTTEVDDLGWFAFDGVLPGPISLVIRTAGDLEVLKTEWTVL